MSRELVDLSVLPIDVGFDLRAANVTIAVPADTRSAAYDHGGVECVVHGTADEIVEALTAAGYTCVLVGAREPRII